MRTVIRTLVLLILVAVVAFVAFGWWTGSSSRQVVSRPADAPAGTTGTVNPETARERGAELGEKAARAAGKVEETVREAGLTAKIKAKMALDDRVKARAIDVTTSGSTVFLSGAVRSAAEHDRAVRLARETDGVTDVVDRLSVDQR